MAMRFQLLEKSASQHSWTQVSGGDLGRWITPENPTLGQRPGDRWIVKKQVVSLAAPATYRFRVGFRWTGAHARGLGTTTRLSRTCFQPELRPDLYVKSITVKSAGHRQAQDQYTAVIGDAGATGAGPFKVQFADGALTETRTVQFLGAHKEMRIKPFLGPPCAQGPATVTVDPNDQVDDYNRANNSLTVSCS
jgi:hypothetical protein